MQKKPLVQTESPRPVDTFDEEARQRGSINIAGMRCASCVQLIELRMNRYAGVDSFKINLASQKAEFLWRESVTSLNKIMQAVTDLGYPAFPVDQSATQYQGKLRKMSLWRLFVAGFAMMQVMMYAFPAYLVPIVEVDGDLPPDLDKLLKLASLAITLPVMGFSAYPFFKGALRDLKLFHIGMDVPVALGILLTFLASCWNTFFGGPVYFDSAIMFVFLLLGARFIEEGVQAKTSAVLQGLTQIHTVLTQRFLHYPERDVVEHISADMIRVGDVLLVSAGEQIPCDGVVIAGHSECDEALMTGESVALAKTVDSKVIAGAINLHSALVIQAQQVGADTQLANLVRMMETASLEKPRLVQLADKHASRFLLAILLIAVVSGAVWAVVDPSKALWIAISVIVVTCPCALSLATPGVMSAAIGRLAKHGMLVRKGRAIESLANVSHFVFDKTGTLTTGKLTLLETVFQCCDAPSEEALEQRSIKRIAATITALSMHPVSKAIAVKLQKELLRELMRDPREEGALRLTETKEIAGDGIEACIAGKKYRVGRLSFVQALSNVSLLVPIKYSAKTLSFLGDERGVMAFFVLDDSLRDDAKEALDSLVMMGKEIVLLSGDRLEVVRNVATACGIQTFQAELSPLEKHAVIKALQAQGASVAMVGDGMNDGPALSLANVAIAMGQGSPLSQTRSDCLLMSNRLTDLSFSVRVAQKAYRLIQQNLAWALVYNVVAIPAAVLGWLEPWHAALGMSLSSLIVVLNGLRLLRMQPISVAKARAGIVAGV